MWACAECHHFYHFSCINEWSRSKSFPWQCPTCKRSSNMIVQPRCWCGKKHHDDIENEGNSCGANCLRTRMCNSPGVKCIDICTIPCHPGPCDAPRCLDTCDMMKVPEPVVTKIGGPRPLTAHVINNPAAAPLERESAVQRAQFSRPSRPGRTSRPTRAQRRAASRGPVRAPAQQPQNNNMSTFRQRWNTCDASMPLFCLFIYLVVNTPLVIWAVYNAKWWTQPLVYRFFVQHRQPDSIMVGAIVTVIEIAINGFLASVVTVPTGQILIKLFNLPTKVSRRGEREPSTREALIVLLLFACWVGMVVWFPIT